MALLQGNFFLMTRLGGGGGFSGGPSPGKKIHGGSHRDNNSFSFSLILGISPDRCVTMPINVVMVSLIISCEQFI